MVPARAVTALVVTLFAVACDEGLAGPEDIAGVYVATTLVVTPSGESPIDVSPAGARSPS